MQPRALTCQKRSRDSRRRKSLQTVLSLQRALTAAGSPEHQLIACCYPCCNRPTLTDALLQPCRQENLDSNIIWQPQAARQSCSWLRWGVRLRAPNFHADCARAADVSAGQQCNRAPQLLLTLTHSYILSIAGADCRQHTLTVPGLTMQSTWHGAMQWSRCQICCFAMLHRTPQ